MNVPHDAPFVLPLASADATLDRAGGKGASLARLAAAEFPVPGGFHVTTDAYRRFMAENHLGEVILAAAAKVRADTPATQQWAALRIQALIAQGRMPDAVAAGIRRAYGDLGGRPAVAVRSSATAEDLPGLSFAGQQETYLNVTGDEAVLAAVQRCWASLWTARALGYRARQGIPAADVALAVVVQVMVPADVAGILFTANPISGVRDEVVINAAWGLGEAIVGGAVSPDTFVVSRASGTLVSQRIADKAVRTVRTPDGTREQPVPRGLRRKASLSDGQAGELARLGLRIEALYGQPMDIEWALTDRQWSILQARPITALPEPRAVLDWSLPRPGGKYARSSVIELLPDPLSPLFATLALPLWNDASRDLMSEIGLGDALPDTMLVTINDYAFYDFGMSPSQSAQMLAALLTMMRPAARWIGRAESRWRDEARPSYVAAVSAWSERDIGALSAAELLAGTRAIVRAAASHYVAIQSGILPSSYMSEALFTSAYNRFARRREDPSALTFMLGFESEPILAEESLYDLGQWVRTRPELANGLARSSGADIAGAYVSGTPVMPSANDSDWHDFVGRLAEHLRRFGHMVYDLDFAKGVLADEPEPLIEALKYFLTEAARNPYERQAGAAHAREAATAALLARLDPPRRRLFTRLVGWAQRYAPLREDALAEVGLGWPQVRRLLRELGNRLVAAGGVDDVDDVFWLTAAEVDATAPVLEGGGAVPDLRAAVAERRARWGRERAVAPPVALPLKGGTSFLGFDFSRFLPAPMEPALGAVLAGQGASPGRVTGTARVIHGPAEFSQMRPGDILVARITTPAWTPLFALAAGIVTDTGGALSHSSIVAREYSIPAVLGTGVATARIQSGQQITVDGDAGTVTIAS